MSPQTKTGRARDGAFGGILIFGLPVVIALVAGWFFWANLGTDDALDLDEGAAEAPAATGG